MTRTTLAGILALALATTLIAARPAATPPALEPKLAVVDLEQVLTLSPAGKRASEAFEASRKQKQAALDQQQKELTSTNAELEKQKATLDPQEFEKRRKALEQSLIAVQQSYVKLERELATERTTLLQDLMQLAGPELDKIAKAEGLALIFDKAAVAWHEPALDVTERLAAQLK